jgi:hypothetical protein
MNQADQIKDAESDQQRRTKNQPSSEEASNQSSKQAVKNQESTKK